MAGHEAKSIASTRLRYEFTRVSTDALRGIPTIVTKLDQPTLVVISYDEWQRLRALEEAQERKSPRV